jgi:hypothetical protein
VVLPLGLEEIPYQIQFFVCVLNGTILLVLQSSENGAIHLLNNKIRDDLFGNPKGAIYNPINISI